jgi:hypothetical protein
VEQIATRAFRQTEAPQQKLTTWSRWRCGAPGQEPQRCVLKLWRQPTK